MSISFVYHVYRFSSNDGSILLTSDQLDELFDNAANDAEFSALEDRFSEVKISLYVSGSGHYTPAKTSGDPADCYDQEFDYELDSVEDDDRNDWKNLLTEDEKDEILSMIAHKVYRGEHDYDYSSYFDSRY
jgi:hypothetical protein